MEKIISSLLNIKDQLEQSLQRFNVLQQHLNDLRDSHNKMQNVFQQHMNEFEQGFVNLENQIYALQEEEKYTAPMEEKEVVNSAHLTLSHIAINPIRNQTPFPTFSDLPLKNYFHLSSFLSIVPSTHYSLIEIKQGLAIRWEFDPGGIYFQCLDSPPHPSQFTDRKGISPNKQHLVFNGRQLKNGKITLTLCAQLGISLRSKLEALPTFVLVDRRDGFFTLRAWNAQKAGASAVLVTVHIEEAMTTMDTPPVFASYTVEKINQIWEHSSSPSPSTTWTCKVVLEDMQKHLKELEGSKFVNDYDEIRVSSDEDGVRGAWVAASIVEAVVYKALEDFNSLVGLLPKVSVSYKLDQASRRFYTYLKGSCSYSLKGSYELKYKSTIKPFDRGRGMKKRLSSLLGCGEGEWRTCMGLQVLVDTNLAPQLLAFLPHKVIFKPFDRGRERISNLRPYFQVAAQSCGVKNWDANTGEVRNKLKDLMCDLGPSFIKVGRVAFNIIEEELDQPLETMSLKHNNMAWAELIFPLICELDIRAYHKLSDAAIHSPENSSPRLDSIDRFKCSCVSDETLLEIPLTCTNFHFTNASNCPNISLGIVRRPILTVSELHNWEDITSTLMAAISQSYMWEVLSDKGVVELALGCGKSLKSLSGAACAKIADISLETMGSHCKSLETLSLDSEYMSNKGLLVVAKEYNIRTMELGYAATPIDGVIIVKREVAVGIKKILVFDPGGGTIVGKISHLVDKVLLWGMVCHTYAIEIGRTKVIAGLG